MRRILTVVLFSAVVPFLAFVTIGCQPSKKAQTNSKAIPDSVDVEFRIFRGKEESRECVVEKQLHLVLPSSLSEKGQREGAAFPNNAVECYTIECRLTDSLFEKHDQDQRYDLKMSCTATAMYPFGILSDPHNPTRYCITVGGVPCHEIRASNERELFTTLEEWLHIELAPRVKGFLMAMKESREAESKTIPQSKTRNP
ncbi:MAG: hypothetical protein JW818_02045 [Pirellulales bacterium]|nr:hypothetical protein [Pirellulales bacterium]